MAIGHEFSSSMKPAILLLMTALFLYGNVATSFLILRRNVSALFTFRCCLRERGNHFLTLPSMSPVSGTLRRKKQNRTLSMVWWRGGIVVECHSRLQNFEGRWFLSYMLWSAIFNSKHTIKLDIMDNKKTITSSSAMLDLWWRTGRLGQWNHVTIITSLSVAGFEKFRFKMFSVHAHTRSRRL